MLMAVADHPSGPAALQAQLGESAAAFVELLALLPSAKPEWRTYGRASGWVLKLIEGKRTMCYVQPLEGSFRVTVVLGNAAAEAALVEDVSPATRSAIRDARVYVEGRSVPVLVKSAADLADVAVLLGVKRGAARRRRMGR